MIVHTVPAISEEASGPSYSVVRLCESLIERGHEVKLATLGWSPMASSPPFLKAFPLGLGPRRLGLSPKMYQWLVGKARTDSIEIIHNHSLWMMPNVYPGRVARKYHLPLVVSPRGTLSKWSFQSGSAVKRVFWPLAQKPVLDIACCFHATAESEYQDIRRMGFVQPIAIIPNGIDISTPKAQIERGARTLLFLGRIHPIKGLDMLLYAWKAASPRFPEWRLRIAGPDNGGYLPKMQALATELRLERVDFVGPLFGKAKHQAYREAELFVLPTHSENFGMTVAESLAAGTPAIVSQGAPWSGLESRGAGWWIEIGLDPLVACLEAALTQSRASLQAMGERGRMWMGAEFSWAEVAHQMTETYRWILHGGDKPTCVTEG